MERLAYYDANIPCLAACPVHTNAGAYVAAIAEGQDDRAYLTARLPNPFASVCGRVCAAPCEDACRRGLIDEPVAIRALKRYVTEKHGPHSKDPIDPIFSAGRSPDRPENIAIVGGGPAGLTAAHDLRRFGYGVTLFEATSILGGMMRLGIPGYRLDRELLDAEIAAVVDLGVTVETSTRLGTDVQLSDLRERFDAVFLAVGATLGRDLNIPGHDADGVFKAIEFLININLGFKADIGERVVIVGGGNVAMDAARTALRAEAYGAAVRGIPEEMPVTLSAGGHMEAFDVARSAVRAGAKEVTVISLESRDEMPAAEFEINDALEEGIRFVHRRGPQSVVVEDGVATALKTVGVESVFDEDGRFAPVFVEDDLEVFEVDTLILAIGQAVDIEALGDAGPKVGPRRTIEVDVGTLETSLPGVWAGGDSAHGPRNLIDAIADGRRAAASIHTSFGGEVPDEDQSVMSGINGYHRLDDLYDRIPRQSIPSVATERRIGLSEVELGFTEEQARLEASRCLRCFANIELDVSRCVLCALCVDVCPHDLISMVPVDSLGALAEVGETSGTALLLDESICIRCGLCIERCPDDALSMSMWNGLGSVAALRQPDLKGVLA